MKLSRLNWKRIGGNVALLVALAICIFVLGLANRSSGVFN
jgi:hypothetical protein